MRTVVVGASTGLGRCTAIALGQRGDQVALMARRKDKLDVAAAEAGPTAHAIACDVTDPEACRSAIEEAATTMGGIDAVVYCTAVGVLSPIDQVDVESWERSFATNVTGASLITVAALPYLKESKGVCAYFTSASAALTAPWPGLGAYIVSKAALDKLVEVWRSEHPEVGFTRIVVGECGGGEGDAQSHFIDGWDTELAAKLFPIWNARGLIAPALVDFDHVFQVVEGVLRAGATASVPSVAVIPRHPPLEY